MLESIMRYIFPAAAVFVALLAESAGVASAVGECAAALVLDTRVYTRNVTLALAQSELISRSSKRDQSIGGAITALSGSGYLDASGHYDTRKTDSLAQSTSFNYNRDEAEGMLASVIGSNATDAYKSCIESVSSRGGIHIITELIDNNSIIIRAHRSTPLNATAPFTLYVRATGLDYNYLHRNYKNLGTGDDVLIFARRGNMRANIALYYMGTTDFITIPPYVRWTQETSRKTIQGPSIELQGGAGLPWNNRSEPVVVNVNEPDQIEVDSVVINAVATDFGSGGPAAGTRIVIDHTSPHSITYHGETTCVSTENACFIKGNVQWGSARSVLVRHTSPDR